MMRRRAVVVLQSSNDADYEAMLAAIPLKLVSVAEGMDVVVLLPQRRRDQFAADCAQMAKRLHFECKPKDSVATDAGAKQVDLVLNADRIDSNAEFRSLMFPAADAFVGGDDAYTAAVSLGGHHALGFPSFGRSSSHGDHIKALRGLCVAGNTDQLLSPNIGLLRPKLERFCAYFAALSKGGLRSFVAGNEEDASYTSWFREFVGHNDEWARRGTGSVALRALRELSAQWRLFTEHMWLEHNVWDLIAERLFLGEPALGREAAAGRQEGVEGGEAAVKGDGGDAADKSAS
jgi:hypothetical protein